MSHPAVQNNENAEKLAWAYHISGSVIDHSRKPDQDYILHGAAPTIIAETYDGVKHQRPVLHVFAGKFDTIQKHENALTQSQQSQIKSRRCRSNDRNQNCCLGNDRWWHSRCPGLNNLIICLTSRQHRKKENDSEVLIFDAMLDSKCHIFVKGLIDITNPPIWR
jgi:hypothetical protein